MVNTHQVWPTKRISWVPSPCFLLSIARTQNRPHGYKNGHLVALARWWLACTRNLLEQRGARLEGIARIRRIHEALSDAMRGTSFTGDGGSNNGDGRDEIFWAQVGAKVISPPSFGGHLHSWDKSSPIFWHRRRRRLYVELAPSRWNRLLPPGTSSSPSCAAPGCRPHLWHGLNSSLYILDRERIINLNYIYNNINDVEVVNIPWMRKTLFSQLVKTLRDRQLLKDSIIHTFVDQQVAMFLYVIGHNWGLEWFTTHGIH
jgi:hypothetical protein